ncbi:MAG: dihydrolipoyl dehydrogenase [Bacillota bacterium]|jgi:dihydrolipoamide dehydrogenase|nr:dihydrolipoyl dehydrogenase [Bacillota bacterium]
MRKERFDVVFLGGGPAGYQGAIRAAQLGLRESRHLGGVCLNRGCIPTKAIKASVDVLARARRARDYGLKIENAQPDLRAIIARKDKVVSLLRGGIAQLFRANGVSLYEGHGRLAAPDELEVEGEGGLTRLKAKKIVIATGSRPYLPGPFAGGKQGVLTTDDILELSEMPESLVIVGGGAVGVEMAAIMVELGSTVTLLESRERILPREDAEMSAYLARMLRKQKVKIITGVAVTAVEPGVKAKLTLSDGQLVEANAVLTATGRLPNVEEIGLEKAGLGPDDEPLEVNEYLETSIPGIYAAGDVTGGRLLAHVAFAEGITAAENAAGMKHRMDYRVVPRCIFTIPEFAAVGLTEEEAKERFPATTVSFPFKSLGMAQALGEREGLVKLVVHKGTGEILGGHIIGPHASDLIAEIALAMRHRLPARGIVETIHAHPSLPEAVLEAAHAACGQAIHILPQGKP